MAINDYMDQAEKQARMEGMRNTGMGQMRDPFASMNSLSPEAPTRGLERLAMSLDTINVRISSITERAEADIERIIGPFPVNAIQSDAKTPAGSNSQLGRIFDFLNQIQERLDRLEHDLHHLNDI
jgi:hypothetical protein